MPEKLAIGGWALGTIKVFQPIFGGKSVFDSIFNSHPLFRRIGALSFAFMVTLASPVQSTEISILGTSGVGDESASYYVASELPDREVHVIGLYEAGNNALNVPPEIANDPEAFPRMVVGKRISESYNFSRTGPCQLQRGRSDGANNLGPVILRAMWIGNSPSEMGFKSKRSC